MITKAYSNHIFKLVSGVFVIVIMFLTVGEKLVFDGVLAVSLVVIAAMFRDNKDIMGVCLVVVVIHVLINAVFVFSSDGLAWRIAAYAVTIATLAVFYSDNQSKIVLGFLAISLGAEIYWFFTGYDGPEIYFSFIKISVFIAAKFFVLYRSQATKLYLKDDSSAIRLDWLVHKTLSVSVLLELSCLLEYLIRHNTDFSPMVVYYIYPYIAQFIGVFILWLILNQASQTIKSQTMSA
jgi:hypothetical protein